MTFYKETQCQWDFKTMFLLNIILFYATRSVSSICWIIYSICCGRLKTGSNCFLAATDALKSFGYSFYDIGHWFHNFKSTDAQVNVSWSLF